MRECDQNVVIQTRAELQTRIVAEWELPDWVFMARPIQEPNMRNILLTHAAASCHTNTQLQFPQRCHDSKEPIT